MCLILIFEAISVLRVNSNNMSGLYRTLNCVSRHDVIVRFNENELNYVNAMSSEMLFKFPNQVLVQYTL